MARESFEDAWNAVLAQCPTAGADLCRRWTGDSFLDLAERRHWSWRLKRGRFDIPAAYSTGTFDATSGSSSITGTLTVWTAAMAGRQFTYAGITYDILSVQSNTSLTLSQPWAGDDVSAGSYSIQQIYVTPASDFFCFKSVIHPSQSLRLVTDVTAEELDYYDPDRTYAGDPCCLASSGYATSQAGIVYPTIQALGSGAKPSSSGTYTGADDAVFTVEITTTGVVGAADFRWKKNEGAYTSGVVSAASNTLQEGVAIAFGAGSFTDGDIFVIRAEPVAASGLPRFELYPHQSSRIILPYWYIQDVDTHNPESTGGVLPRFIPGYVLREGALGRAARWAGSTEQPNPYAQIARAEAHEKKFESLIHRLELEDNEIAEHNVQRDMLMPYASLPWGSHSGDYSQDTDYGWQ